MKSLLVEFLRYGRNDTGFIRQGDQYLVTCTGQPVKQFSMRLDHGEFLDHMRALRYERDEKRRKRALQILGRRTSTMLETAIETEHHTSGLLQIDLVLNPAELAALPFEAAAVLRRRGAPMVLTRRIRGEFAESSLQWPARPRILFAWASPPGVSQNVPVADHQNALEAALSSWIPAQPGVTADSSALLTIVPEANPASIERACLTSDREGRPFTHIHLLAHGYQIGSHHNDRFGIALHGDDGGLEAVEPEALKSILGCLAHKTLAVTLATCDGANDTNTIIPKKSIAHELHRAGFPIVVASQLPFTVPGSTVMVKQFYQGMLAGQDVRQVLYDTRLQLYKTRGRKERPTGHDWASLLAYVRLPEGYTHHLEAVRLKAVLESLKTVHDASRQLLGQPARAPDRLEAFQKRLLQHIKQLKEFLEQASPATRQATRAENQGLLGSAEKRLAELYFAQSRTAGAADATSRMRAALERALSWYREEFDSNLSNHWAGTQCLALEAALHGRFQETARWYAAVLAARNDPTAWAHGSLAELYLLAPLAAQPDARAMAREQLELMRRRLAQEGGTDPYILEATHNQLRRYATWWTSADGFFPDTTDLSAAATEVLRDS